MPSITLDLPDELATRLSDEGDRLAEILELGLRAWTAGTEGEFEGAAEVLEFLARLPAPAEILNLRPSDRFSRRVGELLEKNRSGELNARERAEWERYEYLEHLVRMAKIAAAAKLASKTGDA
jgi:hypothetical protein